MEWPEEPENERWQEFDDSYGQTAPRQTLRKRRKRSDGDEEDDASRSDRSGKRFHRNKTLKDMTWE